jgi:V/A-type H+-transporting ATPase subunit I
MDYLIIVLDGVIDAVLENFFRFLSNTVSYGRILALALAHAVLIEVFILLTFMSAQLSIAAGILVFLLGTLIVVILEAIMAGIQTIRLHYYEWFTKFYEGGGVEFSPFQFCRRYTE